MEKITLKNGLKIYLKKTNSTTVTIQANIKIGSANENSKEKGYSHFVEHMLFEGTKKRNNFQIANEIEKVGGELNGATSSNRTIFYIKVPKKYSQKALDILSDILLNASFEKKMFNKEKKVILSEIDLYYDDPKLHQWTLFENNLFNSNLKNSTLGTKYSIKNCKRENLIEYYKKHYLSENIFFTIAGNYSKFNFKQLEKITKGKTSIKLVEKPLLKNKKIIEKRKISQSYIIVGYKTIEKNNDDSIILDVIHSILGRGVSGKLFDEIRNKRGLGYSVYNYSENGKSSGLFAIAVSTKKENLNKVENIIKTLIKNLKNINKNELNEAKEYILGKHQMEIEDTRYVADELSEWIHYSNLNKMKQYFKKIKNITKKDILNVVNKYLKKNLTIIISQK